MHEEHTGAAIGYLPCSLITQGKLAFLMVGGSTDVRWKLARVEISRGFRNGKILLVVPTSSML